MKKVIAATLALGAVMSSCENSDWEFPDYTTQSVYFAKQNPVRTLVLGTDIFPNDLDNQHKCKIQATMGGVYENGSDRVISFKVDNSVFDKYVTTDANGNALVAAMPTSYYKLSNSSEMVIPSGSLVGGVEVELTPDFFNDPKSLTSYYAIPLMMTDVAGADTILQSKNHILYFVKYINKWDSSWLSQGTDEVTSAGSSVVNERKAKDGFWEYADIRQISTVSLDKAKYTVPTNFTINGSSHQLTCDLVLSFSTAENDAKEATATITADAEKIYSADNVQYTVSVTGSAKWTFEGAEKAWGDKNRDLLDLNYEIVYTNVDGQIIGSMKTSEKLVMRHRGVTFEEKGLALK